MNWYKRAQLNAKKRKCGEKKNVTLLASSEWGEVKKMELSKRDEIIWCSYEVENSSD